MNKMIRNIEVQSVDHWAELIWEDYRKERRMKKKKSGKSMVKKGRC